MNLHDLQQIIQASGGGPFAQEYAEIVLTKVIRLERTGSFGALFQQLRAAKNEGDLRGRLLEVNFADAFASQGILLDYGVKQGGSGDIDFRWRLPNVKLFFEMKLLGQDQATKQSIDAQLAARGFSVAGIKDDTYDLARIQRDIYQKASPKKFACPQRQSGSTSCASTFPNYSSAPSTCVTAPWLPQETRLRRLTSMRHSCGRGLWAFSRGGIHRTLPRNVWNGLRNTTPRSAMHRIRPSTSMACFSFFARRESGQR